MTDLQWLHIFIGFYSTIAILWGVFSAVVVVRRRDFVVSVSSVISALILNTILCPFAMMIAIYSVYVGDIRID